MKMNKRFLQRIKQFLPVILTDLGETDFFGVCYQTAFYILLTFFPFAIFLINFVGNIISTFENYMYDFLKSFLPDLVFNYVRMIIDNLKVNEYGNHLVMLIVAFIFASLTIYTILKGLSQNSRNNKPLVDKRQWLFIILITIFFILSLTFIIAEYLVLDIIVERIFTGFGLNQGIINMTKLFSFTFTGIALVMVFIIMYTLTSPQQMKVRDNIPGAVLTVLILVIFFQIYVYIANHSIRFTLFYGKLGGFFLFMVVIYFSTVIVNIGCKCNLYLYCLRYQNGILFPI